MKLDTEESSDQPEEKSSGAPVFDFRQIFDKYIHVHEDRKHMKNTRGQHDAADNPLRKDDMIQRNIHRLEQLREKSYDKEV